MSDAYATLSKYEELLEDYVAKADVVRPEIAKVQEHDAVTPALLRAFDEEVGKLFATVGKAKRAAQAAKAKGAELTSEELLPLSTAMFRTDRALKAIGRELTTFAGEAHSWNARATKSQGK